VKIVAADKHINPSNGNHKQGENEMTEQNFWESLTDEEKAEASAGMEALQQQIEGKRMQARIAEYIAKMRAARGDRQAVKRIKEQAQREGVPVDTVDFS
jgi:hypothetical protein